MRKISNGVPLLVVGSVAFDSIKTPFGKANKTLGGSASYFSLAASYFVRPAVVAVVGEDFRSADEKKFLDRKINIQGLQKAKGKTFSWGGEYSFDLNSRVTKFLHLNVFEKFNPLLSPNHKNADYIFLGNIAPKLQLNVLKQIKNPKLIGLDTIDFWINTQKKALLQVLKLVNVFVINEEEARELTKEHNLLKAAKGIKGIMGIMGKKGLLIIKRGEYGLLMFNRDSSIFHLPGFPLEDVVDPTGAGDSFAGGMFGYLAKTRDLSTNNFKKACAVGSTMASFCVEDFGTKRLESLKAGDIAKRLKAFKNLTDF